jgi:histidyl-tRNA synthetase
VGGSELTRLTDREGNISDLALRPEMTPSVTRMVAARYPQLPKPIRWFSIANFYRNERPQRGRNREFWQLNVDLFGDTGER